MGLAAAFRSYFLPDPVAQPAPPVEAPPAPEVFAKAETPPVTAEPTPEVAVAQLGTGGTASSGGYPHSKEKSIDLKGSARWKTLMEMVYNVTIIGAAVRRRAAVQGSVDWTVKPAKDTPDGPSPRSVELAEFVDRQLKRLKTPWSTVVERAGLHEPFGVNLQEIRCEHITNGVDAGRYGLADIQLRPIETIEKWLKDETDEWAAVVQRGVDDQAERIIPLWKLLRVVDNLLSDHPEGTGTLRHAAEKVRQLLVFENIEAMGFQNGLEGTPLVRSPRAAMLASFKGTEEQKQALLNAAEAGTRDFIENPVKRTGKGLTVDSAPYKNSDGSYSNVPMWAVELIKAAGSGHAEIGVAHRRKTWEIAIVLGVEHLMLGSNGAGSNAQQQQKSRDFYVLAMAALGKIAASGKRDIIGLLWALNPSFPEELKPDLTYNKLAFADVAGIMAGLSALAAGGLVLDWSHPYVAELFASWGISPPTQEQIDEMLEAAREAAAAMAGLDKDDPDESDEDDDLEDEE